METQERYVHVPMDDGTIETIQISPHARGAGYLRLERVRGLGVQRLDLHTRTLEALCAAIKEGM